MVRLTRSSKIAKPVSASPITPGSGVCERERFGPSAVAHNHKPPLPPLSPPDASSGDYGNRQKGKKDLSSQAASSYCVEAFFGLWVTALLLAVVAASRS